MNDPDTTTLPAVSAVSTPPPHILIIDDQPAELQLLISYLSDYEFAISLASDGEEGLHRARRDRPDLILLDLHMPAPDGFVVLEQLRHTPATDAIPVLVLSARLDVDSKVRSFGLGAADYLAKPIHEEELRARVTAQFHNARLKLALQRRLRAYEEHYGPVDDHAAHADPTRPPREVARLLEARRILQENLAEPPSLQELARTVGTNQPQLSRGFRTLFGTTVFGFLRETRLQRARELLIGTNLPIKTIALEVGYRNSGDLTRSVKERFGMNPTALRDHG